MSPSDVSDFVVPDEKFTFWNLSTLHRRYLRSHITAVQKSKAMTATTTMATKHSPKSIRPSSLIFTALIFALPSSSSLSPPYAALTPSSPLRSTTLSSSMSASLSPSRIISQPCLRSELPSRSKNLPRRRNHCRFSRITASAPPPPPITRLYSNPNSNDNGRDNQFNLSKRPTFDLLSFRPIRSDALLRYNTLNQSEPLRINLFLLATITFLGYPLWCESVTGEMATVPSIVAAGSVGLGCVALFWRERSKREKQLRRMEKELNAEGLEVRVPVSSAWGDRFGNMKSVTRLKELRGKRRVLAVLGNNNRLREVLNLCCVLRKRLIQSQTLVVLVPLDGSQRQDWMEKDQLRQMGDALWLADPLNVDGKSGWIDYFRGLLEDNDNGDDSSRNVGGEEKLAWFALNFKGRSIASGVGPYPPRLLELMGQQLQPMEILDEADETESMERMPVV